MPCLNPGVRKNPKYLPSKANNFNPPPCPDPRLRKMVFDCGKCVECRRRRASDWRFRLFHEFRSSGKDFHFVTLTFSDEWLDKLRYGYFATRRVRRRLPDGSFVYKDVETTNWVDGIGPDATDNELARFAVRMFLERYRKEYGKSLRHFLVTELGGDKDRIHLHGFFIGCRCSYEYRKKRYISLPKLTRLWSYGHVWVGWCTEVTINYCVKYIMKSDPKHPDFKPLLLLSPGLGKCYVTRATHTFHSVGDGRFYVITSNGHKIAMPRYYKPKFFTEVQLLKHQLDLLDNPPPLVFKGKVYVSEREYRDAIRAFYKTSVRLGCSQYAIYLKNNRDIVCNLEFSF